MRAFRSGFISFVLGVTIIIVYVFISPYKIGADSSPYPMSIFNIIFTVLFLTSCCFVAFQYGKKSNKGGLFGLIGIWALFYAALLFAAIPGFLPILAGLILFGYWTLFLIMHPFVLYTFPAIMIILVTFSWFFGKRCVK